MCERVDATTVTDVRVDATTVTDVRVDTHLRKCCHYKSRLWAGATAIAAHGNKPQKQGAGADRAASGSGKAAHVPAW